MLLSSSGKVSGVKFTIYRQYVGFTRCFLANEKWLIIGVIIEVCKFYIVFYRSNNPDEQSDNSMQGEFVIIFLQVFCNISFLISVPLHLRKLS